MRAYVRNGENTRSIEGGNTVWLRVFNLGILNMFDWGVRKDASREKTKTAVTQGRPEARVSRGHLRVDTKSKIQI